MFMQFCSLVARQSVSPNVKLSNCILNNVQKKPDSTRNACPKAGHLKIPRGVCIQKEYPANRLVQQPCSQKLYAEVTFAFHVSQQFVENPSLHSHGKK